MTTTKTERTVLQLNRIVKAPAERVWKAWTEPGQIAKWFGCAEACNLNVQQDFRVGGEYHYSLTAAEGEVVVMSGVFKEIVPHKKLVYTWNNTSKEYPADDTEVTVEFTAHGGTTEIALTHRNFARPLSAEGHTMGWGAALDKFAALVDQ